MDSDPNESDASEPSTPPQAAAEDPSGSSASGRLHITNTGTISGKHVVIGTGANLWVTVLVSPQGMVTLDQSELQQSLEDLSLHLGDFGLPLGVLMEARAATAQAIDLLKERSLNVQALRSSLKHLGSLLQHAGVNAEPDSPLAAAAREVARLCGPLLPGGERVVLAWFGLPQVAGE